MAPKKHVRTIGRLLRLTVLVCVVCLSAVRASAAKPVVCVATPDGNTAKSVFIGIPILPNSKYIFADNSGYLGEELLYLGIPSEGEPFAMNYQKAEMGGLSIYTAETEDDSLFYSGVRPTVGASYVMYGYDKDLQAVTAVVTVSAVGTEKRGDNTYAMTVKGITGDIVPPAAIESNGNLVGIWTGDAAFSLLPAANNADSGTSKKPVARQGATIAAGSIHTIGLYSDGTVVAIGNSMNSKLDVKDWTDIVAIAAGESNTVGLRSDGTVVAVGNNTHGQCNVSGWNNIVAVAAGYRHTVGLRSDGTVVAVGGNFYGQCDVGSWTNITAIAAGWNYTVGLRSDGTVVTVGDYKFNVDDWNDITAVAAGSFHLVGLRSNGTVVAMANNFHDECNVSDWKNIVSVSAGTNYTVGLQGDGTVVAVGENKAGQCNVSDWTDIVAITSGSNHTVGLRSDGTVVATGENLSGECNVSSWKNIRVPNK